ncbi:hypothetical protein, variant 2 [Exophiala mesophila]|uniref:Zn(2)-C6 fungal-type domain-containing protein n=1 Tax=Exophiala mesophila TaxID=212818 RepID=A0A0D1ZGP6_EXOME|nr:hypothetical protein, variant 2 [Exophiala mesophila]KIV92969.1 hypothetical protein, variant 2 [Exophiala mesophila]
MKPLSSSIHSLTFQCDESKPVCRGCQRLSQNCEYGTNFSFRHYGAYQNHSRNVRHTSMPGPKGCSDSLPQQKWPGAAPGRIFVKARPNAALPSAPSAEDDIYFKHFDSHVRAVLPGSLKEIPQSSILSSDSLRYAVLCLSASNLSMLDTRVDSRRLPSDDRISVFSPIANRTHHDQARKYHDLAMAGVGSSEKINEPIHYAVVLATKVLLAIYHHASTDHLHFRLGIESTHHFVSRHSMTLLQTELGLQALQMWHRLSASSRTSRDPSLLLEGESNPYLQSKYPSPHTMEGLSLTCILRMSSDELIYDILIKTIGIRRRAVVFRAVAGVHNISNESKNLGPLAHDHLERLLGNHGRKEEHDEAQTTFVRGSHLIGLLQIQRDRLTVWKTRIDREFQSSLHDGHVSLRYDDFPPFSRHRDAMNALYYLLCLVMIETLQREDSGVDSPKSTSQTYISPIQRTVDIMLGIIDVLDFATSNTSDVYTFSLTEVLLQLALAWHSTSTFHHILDITWPLLETRGRGFEHSHYPTHLAKRIIALLASNWARGRSINIASLAVEESTPKLHLLAIGKPVDLVVCGHDIHGRYFVDRVPLS